MLSTEMSFAAGTRCEVGVRCNAPLGGVSRVSVIRTVGPRLLFTVGALIVNGVAPAWPFSGGVKEVAPEVVVMKIRQF